MPVIYEPDVIYNLKPLSSRRVRVIIRDVRPAQFHYISDDEDDSTWNVNMKIGLGTIVHGQARTLASGVNAVSIKPSVL